MQALLFGMARKDPRALCAEGLTVSDLGILSAGMASLSWMEMDPSLAPCRGTREMSCTNSQWIFRRSMVVVGSQRSVSHDCVQRSDIITFARWESALPSPALRLLRTTVQSPPPPLPCRSSSLVLPMHFSGLFLPSCLFIRPEHWRLKTLKLLFSNADLLRHAITSRKGCGGQ